MPANRRAARPEPTAITAALLHGWPLPGAQDDGAEAGAKQRRGSVLAAGGSTEVPGAIILAGIAALRAGAGKLQIATCREMAPAVAITVPEARVLGLAQSGSGDIDPSAAPALIAALTAVPAALIGPGMLNIPTVQALLRDVLPALHDVALVLDAGALAAVSADRAILHHLGGEVVLTPHFTEMALLLGTEVAAVVADPMGTAHRAARQTQAVVALKGAATWVATPNDQAYCCTEGPVGLATSGSGDALGGVIAGLLARGATAAQAAVWGVYLHGRAGQVLTARMGRVGFLARELPAEIPSLMAQFDP